VRFQIGLSREGEFDAALWRPRRLRFVGVAAESSLEDLSNLPRRRATAYDFYLSLSLSLLDLNDVTCVFTCAARLLPEAIVCCQCCVLETLASRLLPERCKRSVYSSCAPQLQTINTPKRRIIRRASRESRMPVLNKVIELSEICQTNRSCRRDSGKRRGELSSLIMYLPACAPRCAPLDPGLTPDSPPDSRHKFQRQTNVDLRTKRAPGVETRKISSLGQPVAQMSPSGSP